MHISNLQFDCKPSLSKELDEKIFQMEPSAMTSLWTNQALSSPFSSPWASQDRARCKKCSLHFTWKELPYLGPLEEKWEDLRFTPRLLESGTQKIWSHCTSAKEILAAYRKVWAASEVIGTWSTSLPDTSAASAVLIIQDEGLLYRSCSWCCMNWVALIKP